jgi:isoleucyl-tRNA synthetase
LRKKEGHRVRQPLARLTVLTRDPVVGEAVRAHADVISDELNVKDVAVSADETALVTLSAKANYRRLGPILGARMNEVAKAISDLEPATIERLLEGGQADAAGHMVTQDDVVIDRTPIEGTIVETGPEFACALDTTISEELEMEGLAREIVSRVQGMRRDAELQVTDRITLLWNTEDTQLREAISQFEDHISREVLATEIEESEGELTAEVDVDGKPLRLGLSLSQIA